MSAVAPLWRENNSWGVEYIVYTVYTVYLSEERIHAHCGLIQNKKFRLVQQGHSEAGTPINRD